MSEVNKDKENEKTAGKAKKGAEQDMGNEKKTEKRPWYKRVFVDHKKEWISGAIGVGVGVGGSIGVSEYSKRRNMKKTAAMQQQCFMDNQNQI